MSHAIVVQIVQSNGLSPYSPDPGEGCDLDSCGKESWEKVVPVIVEVRLEPGVGEGGDQLDSLPPPPQVVGNTGCFDEAQRAAYYYMLLRLAPPFADPLVVEAHMCVPAAH